MDQLITRATLPEGVKGYECKHTVYVKGPMVNGQQSDMVFVKLKEHRTDGTFRNVYQKIFNYKRPFWITKKGFRKHKEKKEFEYLDRVTRFECIQADLVNAIKRALPGEAYGRTLKDVCESPYVYGADISTTALIKHHYQSEFPDCKTANTLAILDIETDVVECTNDPILIALTMKDKVVVAATKLYWSRYGDKDKFHADCTAHVQKRLEKYIESRKLNIEIVEVDSPLDAIEAVMDRAHQWSPDFIGIWNINFDLPVILSTIEKYNGDANRIFSDPSVPEPFKTAYYHEGASQKVTASGKATPMHWADRWHWLQCPASFFFVDQACVFRKTRAAKGMEPSYALDYILKKHTKEGKLYNAEADTMAGLEWHVHMQTNDQLDYVAYNIFDCIGCEILDEQPKVRDLALSMYTAIGHSDYANFGKQPRRTVDDLHFEYLEDGKVFATTSANLTNEYDDAVLGINDWIITLEAHMVADIGLRIIEENPKLSTLFFRAVYDLDVTGAYPNGEDTLNASKATCVMEIVAMRGVSETLLRKVALNLSAGTTNAVEIMKTVNKAPSFDNLLELYRSKKQAA